MTARPRPRNSVALQQIPGMQATRERGCAIDLFRWRPLTYRAKPAAGAVSVQKTEQSERALAFNATNKGLAMTWRPFALHAIAPPARYLPRSCVLRNSVVALCAQSLSCMLGNSYKKLLYKFWHLC